MGSLESLRNQTSQLTIMKVAILVLAQQHGGQHGGQHQPSGLMHLIHTEVQALMKANPGMTSAECAQQCDAMFDLMDNTDESSTDEHCKNACQCDIDHNCQHPHPSGMPGQHHGPTGQTHH